MTNKFNLIFGMLFLTSSHITYAKTCDYETLKTTIKVQGFSRVSASRNHLYKSSEKEKNKWIKTFGATKEYMHLKSLNKVEYSFESDMVALKSLQQFALLQYDTEADAILMEENLKKEMQTVNQDNESIKMIKKFGLNTSQMGYKRVNNYIAIFMFGENVKSKALPILEQMTCDNFNFEYFFGKRSVPITFTEDALQKETPYRKKSVEKAALEDAMYTSEVGSPNSLNKAIKLLKKDYGYASEYLLTDDINLVGVALKMKNMSNKEIFSIDVFVAYYDNQDTLIDVARKTVYSIKANTKFELSSRPNSFSRKAKTAFVIFVLVNPTPKT